MLTYLRDLLFIVVTVAGLSACSAPSVPQPTDIAPTATRTPPVAEASPTAATTAQETEPTVTQAPELVIPTGWVTGEALGLRLAHPPGWELVPVPDRGKLDLFEEGGDGWMEIALVNAETAPFWAIPNPQDAPLSILEGILNAASQDGVYQRPRELPDAAGWVAEGTDNIFDDEVMIGIVQTGEQRVLGIGHVTADIAEADRPAEKDRLFPIYEQILSTVAAN